MNKTLFHVSDFFPTTLFWFIFLSFPTCQVSLNAEEKYHLADKASVTDSVGQNGYTDVIAFKGNYIVVGTDGRIECISKSGEKIRVEKKNKYKLNCIFSNGEFVIAAGDNGTILYSFDGENFSRMKSGIKQNINGITSKGGLILAGADKGKILVSKNCKTWSVIQTGAKGNIMSLAVASTIFIGVTDIGEIIKSPDGINWEVKNYNKEYAGFNEPARLKKIIATPNTLAIIGTHDDGSPSILFSTLGNVWSERVPIYHNEQGMICYLTKRPNGITYDPLMDEIILACDNGELFSLPSCSKCNKYLKIGETNFNAMIYDGNSLVIVGDNYFFRVQKL
jgi:hypothetical protein